MILHIKGQVKKPSDWADLQFDGISEYCMKVQEEFGKYRINEPTFKQILKALCSRLQIPKLPVFLDEAHVLLKTKELFLIPQEAGTPTKKLFPLDVINYFKPKPHNKIVNLFSNFDRKKLLGTGVCYLTVANYEVSQVVIVTSQTAVSCDVTCRLNMMSPHTTNFLTYDITSPSAATSPRPARHDIVSRVMKISKHF